MHLFPTFLLHFAFAPAALVFCHKPDGASRLNLWDLLGTVLAVTTLPIQLVSDEQLRKYRNADNYKSGGTFSGDLWKYSRHPNYFGEVMFWLSLIPFALGARIFYSNPWLVLTGPVVMTIFFRISAGMMDKRSLKRRPDYASYQSKTSALIPWWPKS